MKDLIKRYFSGLGLFLGALFVGTIISGISYQNIGTQSAAVFNPESISGFSSSTTGFAWNDNVGWINFGEETSNPAGKVYVSSSTIYGYAWGENIGWISLTCSNDTEADCVNNNYGVSQTAGDGVLTGYAWGENIGWINFNPDGGGVFIDPTTGNFSGHAWGENIGWVTFDGITPGVNTGWRNIEAIICTSFTYSDWSACTGGNKSRTIATSSPEGCVGGDPELTSTCGGDGPTTPACTYDNPIWNACTASSTKTRTLNATNQNCIGDDPKIETETCIYTPPVIASTTPITIKVLPTSINLHVNATTTFSAEVTGTTSDKVLWSVKEGLTSGRTLTSINNTTAVFTTGIATGTAHVVAKLETDQTKSASSTVIISDDSIILPVTITIDPKEIEIYSGESVLFKSFINNTDNKKTTWIIAEENGGTIDDSGLYTSPNIYPNTIITYNIIAKAQADINKTDRAKVIVRLKTDTTSTSTPPTNGTTTPPGGGDDDDKPDTRPGGGSHSGDDDTSILKILDVSNFVTNNIAVLGTTTEQIVLGAKKIIESPAGNAVTKTITTAGVVGGGIAASSVLVLNGTTIADLLFLPFKLWGLLLSALGLKKRNRPWGTVYDSVTKQPIDPAYVTIKNVETKEENMSITDLDGRYGFLAQTGKYLIEANKTNYIFPSKKMAGQNADVLYNDLYFGTEINVQTAGALINKNIPLDPIKFDWNEFVKGKKKLMKFYSRREKLIRIVTDWIFRIGFVISTVSLFLVPAPYNLIIFGLYLLLTILRKFGLRQKALGSLIDKNGDPLSFAIIRIMSPDLNIEITNKVADKIGRYFCLVPKGKYFVKVEKKNDDESYSEVFTSPAFLADNGIINRNFIV